LCESLAGSVGIGVFHLRKISESQGHVSQLGKSIGLTWHGLKT